MSLSLPYLLRVFPRSIRYGGDCQVTAPLAVLARSARRSAPSTWTSRDPTGCWQAGKASQDGAVDHRYSCPMARTARWRRLVLLLDMWLCMLQARIAQAATVAGRACGGAGYTASLIGPCPELIAGVLPSLLIFLILFWSCAYPGNRGGWCSIFSVTSARRMEIATTTKNRIPTGVTPSTAMCTLYAEQSISKCISSETEPPSPPQRRLLFSTSTSVLYRAIYTTASCPKVKSMDQADLRPARFPLSQPVRQTVPEP